MTPTRRTILAVRKREHESKRSRMFFRQDPSQRAHCPLREVGDEEGNPEIGQAVISRGLRAGIEANIEGRTWVSGMTQNAPCGGGCSGKISYRR
jgi:hypothetical protein